MTNIVDFKTPKFSSKCLKTIYDNISLMKQKFAASHRYKRATHCWGSRSYSDTSHFVGLLWTSGQSVTESSAWQHSQQTDVHESCGYRTRNSSNRTAADLRFKPRGHWDRHSYMLAYSFAELMMLTPVFVFIIDPSDVSWNFQPFEIFSILVLNDVPYTIYRNI